jgi:hypothetical protein
MTQCSIARILFRSHLHDREIADMAASFQRMAGIVPPG